MESLPQSWIVPLGLRQAHTATVKPNEGLHINGLHPDFLSCLAAAQGQGVEFMSTTWEPARGQLGRGASGRVYQSRISNETSFAFKSPIIGGTDVQEAIAFRALICEVLILRHPVIRQHLNIIDLEGIAWEVTANGSKVLPVLVFPLAPSGTLWGHMEAGLNALTLDPKLKLCLQIGLGLAAMHSCSKQSRMTIPHPNKVH